MKRAIAQFLGESMIVMLDRLSPDEVTALELATGVPKCLIEICLAQQET
ncbi:hypothetical protein [Nostoc sp. MG11]|nr:hypothetical protein [Nostoc sp. MG11]